MTKTGRNKEQTWSYWEVREKIPAATQYLSLPKIKTRHLVQLIETQAPRQSRHIQHRPPRSA